MRHTGYRGISSLLDVALLDTYSLGVGKHEFDVGLGFGGDYSRERFAVVGDERAATEERRDFFAGQEHRFDEVVGRKAATDVGQTGSTGYGDASRHGVALRAADGREQLAAIGDVALGGCNFPIDL